jgi:hypothetical protein
VDRIRKAKITYKKGKGAEISFFEVLNVSLGDGIFFCGLKALQSGIENKNISCFDQINFLPINFRIFGHQ